MGGMWRLILLITALFLMLFEWISISYRKPILLTVGILYISLAMKFWITGSNLSNPHWWLILYTFTLVWSSDIAAYFGGKLIGGRKLAPSISPSKTWSGAIAGFIFSVLACYIYCKIFPMKTNTVSLLTPILAIISILGDLIESKVKRTLCIKDSSHLIPGHGGILDRLDSFLAVTWGLIIIFLFK